MAGGSLFPCVAALFGAFLTLNLQVSAANEFCPMPIGKLGPVLKVNFTLESCESDNSTLSSSPDPICRHKTWSELVRGEHDKIHMGLGGYWVTVKLYGEEICFAWWMKSELTGYGAEKKENCTSTCFDVNSKNPPYLVEKVHMACDMNMGKKSCRGSVGYNKVTINKGKYKPFITSTNCQPPKGKEGERVSTTLKVKDCIKVTSSSGKTSERCDDAVAIKMKDIIAGKTNSTADLVFTIGEGTTEFRLLSVQERIWATYLGAEELCLAVSTNTADINEKWQHLLGRKCDGGCAGDGSEMVLTYYKETINITSQYSQAFSETEKMLKFISSIANVVQASMFKITILWTVTFILHNVI